MLLQAPEGYLGSMRRVWGVASGSLVTHIILTNHHINTFHKSVFDFVHEAELCYCNGRWNDPDFGVLVRVGTQVREPSHGGEPLLVGGSEDAQAWTL